MTPRHVHHRAASQPIEQVVPIRRSDDVLERVILAAFHAALSKREQMQVVVAKNDQRAILEIAHEAQGGERCGAAVDQVPDEP